MVRLITDSSALFTREEAQDMGFDAIPLSISIGDWDGRDLEMDMDAFYVRIAQGEVPKSSQPPIGEVIDAYEKYPEDDIINLTIADGLSGTYATACSAKEIAPNAENITVLNSTTLCGPHRYLVEQALKMIQQGHTKAEILDWLHEKIIKAESFLMPQDFSFLKRGGRLTPVAATIGGLLKLIPILRATDDGKRLDKFGMKRSLGSAVESIVKYMEKKKLDESYIVYVAHANVLKDAQKVHEIIRNAFPKVEIRMLKLSPAFVTQGGPGCIAVQFIQK